METTGTFVYWLQLVTIRHLVQEDLPALEWQGEYRHFRRLYAEAYRRAQRGLAVLWVAELYGTGVIGQVFIQLLCDRSELADGNTRAYLYSFRILPSYRRAGLGSRMLQHVEADLRSRGFQRLTLNVARDNPLARSLYERHGFQIIAEEPGKWSFIDHNGVRQYVEEPAWRMEKAL